MSGAKKVDIPAWYIPQQGYRLERAAGDEQEWLYTDSGQRLKPERVRKLIEEAERARASEQKRAQRAGRIHEADDVDPAAKIEEKKREQVRAFVSMLNTKREELGALSQKFSDSIDGRSKLAREYYSKYEYLRPDRKEALNDLIGLGSTHLNSYLRLSLRGSANRIGSLIDTIGSLSSVDDQLKFIKQADQIKHCASDVLQASKLAVGEFEKLIYPENQDTSQACARHREDLRRTDSSFTTLQKKVNHLSTVIGEQYGDEANDRLRLKESTIYKTMLKTLAPKAFILRGVKTNQPSFFAERLKNIMNLAVSYDLGKGRKMRIREELFSVLAIIAEHLLNLKGSSLETFESGDTQKLDLDLTAEDIEDFTSQADELAAEFLKSDNNLGNEFLLIKPSERKFNKAKNAAAKKKAKQVARNKAMLSALTKAEKICRQFVSTFEVSDKDATNYYPYLEELFEQQGKRLSPKYECKPFV